MHCSWTRSHQDSHQAPSLKPFSYEANINQITADIFGRTVQVERKKIAFQVFLVLETHFMI